MSLSEYETPKFLAQLGSSTHQSEYESESTHMFNTGQLSTILLVIIANSDILIQRSIVILWAW